MANQRMPNDRYDPIRSSPSDDDVERAARQDTELQPDPELAEGPASNSKILLLALAAALVLGALFYGLNNTRIHEASTAPPAQKAQPQAANPNNQTGMTTGSATNRPTPPKSAPQGTEVDRSATPTTK
ncbi:MAG: hypothetical protein JO283_04160 [Bradyrhizobium sp.]|nr:hypothetical protein [Bradyrhizobium sp.]